MTDADSPLSILKELIRIPSQNPMGLHHSGSDWLERGISEWLCRFLKANNVAHRYDEIESGRGNVIAIVKGDPKRRTILLDAHQDTVPVASMTISPFDPVVSDGRLYGRGACDVKGSMAVILSTLLRLQHSSEQHANVIATFLCDEEHGQLGASHFAKQVKAADSFLSSKPDIAIVSEPTNLDVVVAHKGTVRWKIKTTGVAAHSSDPSQGRSAIYAMVKVVSALQRFAVELSEHGTQHPLCGSPALSVGTIHGGQSVNMVPDQCVIEIDRRIVPGESTDAIMRDTHAFLSAEVDVPFQMLPHDILSLPLVDGFSQPFAEQLRAIVSSVTGASTVIGVPFSTHAPQFAAAGIPTVVFGPGSIEQAHTDDEWIAIKELDQAAETLFRFVAEC